MPKTRLSRAGEATEDYERFADTTPSTDLALGEIAASRTAQQPVQRQAHERLEGGD